VEARGAQAGHDQVTALDVRMRGVRTEGGAASIPAKMMQFIAEVGHGPLADALAESRGILIHINDKQGVIEFATGWIEGRDEGMLFGRRFHREARRRIKRRIRFQEWHKVVL